MIFELAKDFNDAVAAMPAAHTRRRMLELLDEAIRRDIHFIDRHPTTLFQCMWNTCWWYDHIQLNKYYEVPKESWPLISFSWGRTDPKLHKLLEAWRCDKELGPFNIFWILSLRPPHEIEHCLIENHIRHILSIAISPAGQNYVSGSSDGRICLWNAENGKLLRMYDHEEWLRAVIFSPHASSFASAGGMHEGNIRIWSNEGDELLNFHGGSAVWSVVFTPDGTQIYSGHSDGDIYIWDVQLGHIIDRFHVGNTIIRDIAFSPTGDHIVIGDIDGNVRVRTVGANRELWCKRLHRGSVMKVAFSCDGNKVVSQGTDSMRLWDVETGECFQVTEVYQSDLKGFADGPDLDSFRAVVAHAHETTIEDTRTGYALAWYPTPLKNICSVGDCRTWAGADYNFVDIFTLEGGDTSPQRMLHHIEDIAVPSSHYHGRKMIQLSVGGGYTRATVTVGLNQGIAMRTASALVDKCSQYGGSVYFMRDDNPDMRSDVKSIMQITMLAATCGTAINIEVEGEHKAAQKMTMALASALTCTNTYDLFFGRPFYWHL